MYSLNKIDLNPPSLQEIAVVLQKHLRDSFEEVEVSVVKCPDLKQKPFYLAQTGLCGSERIADVGGPPYLMPTPQTDKVYSLRDIATQLEMRDNAFMLGAGAAPFHVLGTNCELMPNIFLSHHNNNQTHYAKVGDNGECVLSRCDSFEFGLMANLYACEGNGGDVLRVHVKRRIGSDNFVTSMRNALNKSYGSQVISLGGVFLINSGKAKLHVMPNFSSTPLLSDDDVNNWLNFYNIDSPLICLSVFHSSDPGLDLRIEHTHCFSDHGVGGHYHYDTTPESVEYEGYFNTAKRIYRIDAPIVTHNIGRD